MRYRSPRPLRRGVTLVEMLVAVTLLVLMMTMIVTIFTSATGAVTGLQTHHQLDGDLRQLDTVIRQDLSGATARMTPPLNPRDNLGYMEYGENSFADLQNEDTDDYIRFTAKAPEGQPFKGRVWLNPATRVSPAGAPQPVMVTSDYAEIIYFLRNGNLYRRVFLVAPNRQASVNLVVAGVGVANLNQFRSSALGVRDLSWQGVNDLSAHPAPSGSVAAQASPIVLSTLGDLTNRENRMFYSRFANDYVNNVSGAATPDGIPDDQNITGTGASAVIVGNGVPDYYPTLYAAMPAALYGENTAGITRPTGTGMDGMAFPYLFPGAYSIPDTYLDAYPSAGGGTATRPGWIHSTDPIAGAGNNAATALAQLVRINHSPLDGGEAPMLPPTGRQTFWGFPTWKETLLPGWNDPYHLLSPSGDQAVGLKPNNPTVVPPVLNDPLTNQVGLPPMTAVYRINPDLFSDGAGSALFTNPATAGAISLWQAAWEDDLIITGVRSFDIKIFDNSYPGYVDLGWGDDLRLQSSAASPLAKPFLAQANGLQFIKDTPSIVTTNIGSFYTLTQTFTHEGRMPPLTTDLRADAQYPAYNVGDNQTTVQRLRRVWDSWSTDYTQAPATGFDPTTKLPIGPPWGRPVYPSYPAPYPAPMRGLQIQIKVVDPRNEKVKTLTIRQDFSDKL